MTGLKIFKQAPVDDAQFVLGIEFVEAATNEGEIKKRLHLPGILIVQHFMDKKWRSSYYHQ